jgi:hypothetical protein
MKVEFAEDGPGDDVAIVDSRSAYRSVFAKK